MLNSLVDESAHGSASSIGKNLPKTTPSPHSRPRQRRRRRCRCRHTPGGPAKTAQKAAHPPSTQRSSTPPSLQKHNQTSATLPRRLVIASFPPSSLRAQCRPHEQVVALRLTTASAMSSRARHLSTIPLGHSASVYTEIRRWYTGKVASRPCLEPPQPERSIRTIDDDGASYTNTTVVNASGG